MRKLFSALSLLFISLFLVQCQKEVSYIGGPDTGVTVPEPISAILQGNIVDENDQPASGVTIRVGNQTATTDADGYFRIRNAALDKKAALVTAEKAGYYKAYRTFQATSGTNQVVIKLIPRDLTGTIDGATGGDVTTPEGLKIALPANGVVSAASGAAYSGPVEVYASFIDPSAADIAERVPGSFMADDKNNRRVTLSSYGMMAVELQSPAGEKLQIKTGSAATITSPIPASLQASAPATIALWFVDAQTGIWKEEGSATKTGNSYVGQVKHFSFWNCDIGIPAVNVTMTVKDQGGHPLVHVLVRIKRLHQNPQFAHGWTDSLGQVSGLVPANENLLLEVLDPCNNAIYSQNIGPYSQNTNLGTITVTPSSGVSLITVQGTLLNCTGGVVDSGFAIVYYNNMVRYAAVNNNGQFSTIFTSCSGSATTYEILPVDERAQQQGSLTAGNIVAPVTNAGSLSACGTSATQFLNYTLDGTNYSISTNDSLMAYTQPLQGTTQMITSIMGARATTTGDMIDFNFQHATAAAGTYPISVFNVLNYRNNTLTPPFNVVITNFPQNIGEYYEGSFSGSFVDGSSVSHNVSGSFRIRKTW